MPRPSQWGPGPTAFTTPITIPSPPPLPPIRDTLSQNLIGQPQAISVICPYIESYNLGLAAPGRPLGVFLLLGPTGTGKTYTVQQLALALHGNSNNLIQIDCGRYQNSHEVAGLIGAPPGYLGHRETPALLTQAALGNKTSSQSSISIILFDEIEKATYALAPLLLSILDQATLQLGDNTNVDFSRSLIFLTSNLGSAQMSTESRGFGLSAKKYEPLTSTRVTQIGTAAVAKHFSPEFINRIDETITYGQLTPADITKVLNLQLAIVLDRIFTVCHCTLILSTEIKRHLIEQGFSAQYGARELKRVIQKQLMQPFVAWLSTRQIISQDSEIVLAAFTKNKIAFSIDKTPLLAYTGSAT